MGKLTLLFKQDKIGDILINRTVNNRDLKFMRFGTSNTPAEDETNTNLSAPVDVDHAIDVLERVGKDVILSSFWPAGTFGAVTLRELAVKFSDLLLALRHTDTAVGLPIPNANTVDIRVDITVTVDQL